jgi:hypothetical protein
MWWCLPVILATQGAVVGGSQSEADQAKGVRHYRKQTSQKGLGAWFKW